MTTQSFKKQLLRDYCVYMIKNRFEIEPNVINAINLLGRLHKFMNRINKNKIRDLDKCIAYVETKLFRRI